MNKTTSEQKTYHEVKVGQTLYRVTSVFKGNVELEKILEDLTVKRVLQLRTSILEE